MSAWSAWLIERVALLAKRGEIRVLKAMKTVIVVGILFGVVAAHGQEVSRQQASQHRSDRTRSDILDAAVPCRRPDDHTQATLAQTICQDPGVCGDPAGCRGIFRSDQVDCPRGTGLF